MKLTEIDYILDRFYFILNRKDDETAATFYIGNRKERINVDDDVRTLKEIIEDVILSESGEDKKMLVMWIMQGQNDVYILSHMLMSRSAYYRAKMVKRYKIYCLCACKGLLKYTDILEEL